MQKHTSLKQNLPQLIIFITYVAIEVFHLYLVKETTFVLYLVILFTLVRLTALLVKAKPLLTILAIFSCIFIASNYKNLYKINSLNLENSKALANNIDSYSSRYWTNQETFKELTQKQESLIKETKELPNIYLVISLIILIELSLVYLVATLKEHKHVAPTNPRGGSNNKSNIQRNVTNVTNKTKVLQNSNNVTKSVTPVTNNKTIVTKDLQTVTSVTNCNNSENKTVTKSRVVANIRAKNPYVTKKVECNKNVTDTVTSVTPKENNVTKSVTNVTLKGNKCNSVANNKESVTFSKGIVTNVTSNKSNVITLVTDKSVSKDNNKQQDIYELSKQEFIAKYKIKESYYRVIKSRLKNKDKQDSNNKDVKLNKTTKNDRENKVNRSNINNTINNNQNFTVNNLQQELMVF